MSAVLSVIGFVLLLVGAAGVLAGGVRRLGLTGRKQSAWLTAAAFGVMLVGGATSPAEPASTKAAEDTTARQIAANVEQSPPTPARSPKEMQGQAPPSQAPAARDAAAPSPRATSAPVLGPLLLLAGDGDGDSWHDSNGVEYRMGLVNAPEVNDCGGSTATNYRKRKLAEGFHARIYSTDTYGRKVAVIYTPSGANLNVLMARDGIANDKYLADFRHENPTLARQLDSAFASAKARRAGIWRSCVSGDAPSAGGAPRPQTFANTASSCHPDYKTCVPVKGDGSGAGSANDLDCGDIRQVVYLRTIGRDSYRLDANDDGVGCESYG